MLWIWMTAVTVSYVVFGCYTFRRWRPFCTCTRLPAIKKRRPPLLIAYIAVASLDLLLLIPNVCLSVVMTSNVVTARAWWSLYGAVFSLCSDCVFVCLLMLTAMRAWVLHFDHEFGLAIIDRQWRNLINPSTNNFFTDNRTSLGGSRFLLKVGGTVWSLLSLCVVLTIACLERTRPLLHRIATPSLRLCMSVVTLLCLYVAVHRTRELRDVYYIRRELKALSIVVSFTALSIIGLLAASQCISSSLFIAIVSSLDAVFVISSLVVQTHYLYREPEADHEPKITDGLCKKDFVPMIAVLRGRQSFELFVRHCTAEMTVESLLFLVEVAQFKGILRTHNVPHRISQHYIIDVQHFNLRELLSQSRQYAMPRIMSCIDLTNLFPSSSQEASPCCSVKINKMTQNEVMLARFGRSILDRSWLPKSPRATMMLQSSLREENKERENCDRLGGDVTISIIRDVDAEPVELELEAVDNRASRDCGVCSLSTERIFEYALVLYEKYVDIDGESGLAINIGWQKRQFMHDVFSKSPEDAIEFALAHSSGDDDPSGIPRTLLNLQLLVNTFLFHCFDAAFSEIWDLLHNNSFNRFKTTDAYKRLATEAATK